MSDDLFAKLANSGRVSQKLASTRRAKEQPVRTTRPGASRGFLAGRLGSHVRFIQSSLKLSGLWSRGKRNARAVQIRRFNIGIADLPATFDGFTLMHLSDLHLDIAPDLAECVVRALRSLTADVVVITGDFRADTKGSSDPAVAAFATVSPHLPAPVYAVLGNHDPLSMVVSLESLGVKVLMNEHIVLKRGEASLALAGIDDPHYFGTDDIEAALDGIPDGVPRILLAHTPEVYSQAAAAGVDLLLAGHTHGGQICLPGGIPLIVNADCPRRYCRGLWQHDQMHGYTSAGTGSSIVDVRFNCPPEIALHTLVSAPG